MNDNAFVPVSIYRCVIIISTQFIPTWAHGYTYAQWYRYKLGGDQDKSSKDKE